MAFIKLRDVRISFFNNSLWEPSAFAEGQKKRYSASFLIPKKHPIAATLLKEIERVAIDKWTEAKYKTVLERLKVDPKAYCFADGDTKDNENYAGCYVLTAKTDSRPLVVDRNPSVDLLPTDGVLYAGCYVNTEVEIYAQNNANGKGIRASLGGVQFYRNGDAFAGGRPSSREAFEDLSAEDIADGSDLV